MWWMLTFFDRLFNTIVEDKEVHPKVAMAAAYQEAFGTVHPIVLRKGIGAAMMLSPNREKLKGLLKVQDEEELRKSAEGFHVTRLALE